VDAAGFDGGPTLIYTVLRSDELGEQARIDITLTNKSDAPGPDLAALGDYRGRTGFPFGRNEYSYTALHLEGPIPASQWACNWLISDLHAIGWLTDTWSAFFQAICAVISGWP